MKTRRFMIGMMAAVLLCTGTVNVMAAETTTTSAPAEGSATVEPKSSGVSDRLALTTSDVELKRSPSETGERLVTLSAGDPVYIMGRIDDDWLMVTYQGMAAFIDAKAVEYVTYDAEAFDKEMADLAQEGEVLVNELDRNGKAESKKGIWSTIMLILAAALIAVGGFTAYKKNAGKKNK